MFCTLFRRLVYLLALQIFRSFLISCAAKTFNGIWWHFFIVGLLNVFRTMALQCRQCENSKLNPAHCNQTHCVLNCRLTSYPCKVALCTTSIRFNDSTNHHVTTPHPICQTEVVSLEDLYSDDQINGQCTPIPGGVICECGFDDCNRVISFPSRGTTENTGISTANQEERNEYVVIALCSGAAFVAVVITAVVIYLCVCRRIRSKDSEYECKLTPGSRLSSEDTSMDGAWDESGKHSYSAYKYSSSVATQYSRGSRGNAPNHNDMRLPITLEKIIGRGRFAEVWKGKLQQEAKSHQVVSVKVFQLRDYGAWRQEKDMLIESWMRHENIIEFYSSEQRTVRGRLQYWLVTAYYQHGSLAEFLRSNILDWAQFCEMAISIANGLSYLHAERDLSGRAKIPIAHRDVKSCNILVKNGCRSCVLADFGLSLKLDPTLSLDELSNAGQVGTSRYMAPELLERLVNLIDIEMFKRVDVYAMALVLWEMANRCEATEGMAAPYSPPFGNQINDYPTKQQMLLLVCRQRQQPDIPDKWRAHKGLSKFVDEILTESWDYEPEARITAGCVYERFLVLRDDLAACNIDETETKLREKVESNVDITTSHIISTVV